MKFLQSVLAALCLSATAAHATPVTWDINANNAGFAAQGSFVYDAPASTVSDIAILFTIPAGNLGGWVPGTRSLTKLIDFSEVSTGSFFRFGVAGDATNTARLELVLPGSIAALDLGGTINVPFGFVVCGNADCSTRLGGSSLGTKPSTGTPMPDVPLPATGALFFGALGLLGWRARRRSV